MQLEIVPPLDERTLAAIHATLSREGLVAGASSAAACSAWARAAIRDAVDNQPAAAYARSPLSTRGATRA
jgi:hypothetical protein